MEDGSRLDTGQSQPTPLTHSILLWFNLRAPWKEKSTLKSDQGHMSSADTPTPRIKLSSDLLQMGKKDARNHMITVVTTTST